MPMPMLTPQPLMQNNHLLHKSRQFGGSMDYGQPMTVFFKCPKYKFLSIGQISPKNFEILQCIFGSLLKICHCVSLVHDFALLTQPFFFQKARIFIHLQDFYTFTGFSILVWDMDLGSRELEIQSSCVRSPWGKEEVPQ